MAYDMALLDKCGGASLTPLELRGNVDLRIAENCSPNGTAARMV